MCVSRVFSQIQLKEIFETDTDIALVLELVTGGELFDRYISCVERWGGSNLPHMNTWLQLTSSCPLLLHLLFVSTNQSTHIHTAAVDETNLQSCFVPVHSVSILLALAQNVQTRLWHCRTDPLMFHQLLLRRSDVHMSNYIIIWRTMLFRKITSIHKMSSMRWERSRPHTEGCVVAMFVSCDLVFVSRIVERGYYSERDAAHVIKQILEAVAVSLLPSVSVLTVRKIHHCTWHSSHICADTGPSQTGSSSSIRSLDYSSLPPSLFSLCRSKVLLASC